ncbi:unnamed protein product [Owenia fusiformis]|uniref:Uncharacterized protein n=1 Tax=Owenia fusiformis TaxID=6347 RepID=A0A8J1U4J4_OWEFU|nr:unnamed protein product [Owenia fusiformis]
MDYLIIVYVTVPLIIVALLIVLVYICCSKKYKLNWFERNLLEEQEEQAYIANTGYIQTDGLSSAVKAKKYKPMPLKHQDEITIESEDSESSDSDYGPKYKVIEQNTPIHSITSVKSIRSNRGSTKSAGARSGLSEDTTTTSRSIGARSSISEETPRGSVRSSGARSSISDDSSYSSPTNRCKQRAKSLIPGFLGQNHDFEGSIYTPPPSGRSSVSTEFTFNLPATQEKLPESVQLQNMSQQVAPRASGRRRASMQDAIDFTKIDFSLYDKNDIPTQSSFGSIPEENLGSVNFSLSYDVETGLLAVHLIQARELVAKETAHTGDPYCTLSILPDKRTCVKSKVQKKTRNPMFDEEFIFDIHPKEMKNKTFEILFYDYDQFSQHDVMGQVHLALKNIDLNEKVTLWKGISAYTDNLREKGCQELGDVLFSLAYLSTAERLTVVIHKARNLKQDDGKSPDTYAKVSLIYAGRRLKKKKTSTKRNTIHPVWNEALTFSLGNEFLNNINIEVEIINDNFVGNRDTIGHVILGPESSGDEHAHWTDMTANKSAIARWHQLYRSDR